MSEIENTRNLVGENLEKFTQRKQDHIRLSLEGRHQAEGLSEIEKIELVAEKEALGKIPANTLKKLREKAGEALQQLKVMTEKCQQVNEVLTKIE